MSISGFTNPNLLGIVPEGWKVQSIESLYKKVTSGGTPLRSNQNFYLNGTIDWFKTQELNNWYIKNSEEKITCEALNKSSAKLFPVNTILMAMYGDGKTITNLGILTKEAASNQACCALIVEPKICHYLYLFYALKYHRQDFIHIATGGAQRNLSGTLIRNFAIKLPPLPKQKAIAHILGKLDDKIELNQQMNQTLEAMAKAIFKSWFVDFDPVKAKMEGRHPVGMDTATAELFPDSFEESVLGLIPRGWRVGTVGDIIDIFDSKRIPLSNQERIKRQGCYPYYGAASVMDYVDDYLFDGIYILMGEDGSVIDSNGYPIIQYVWEKFWVNNHAHVLKGSNSISDEHLMLFLKQTNISAYVTGAVQPKVNQGNLKRIPFIIPANKISEYFEQKISLLYALIRSNTEQIRTLSAIRDTLLPKLMSGEIWVKEAESIIEAVA